MKFIQGAVTLATLVLAGGAFAQSYPAKQVVFISSVAGGSSDAYMRAVLEKAKENTGSPPLVFEPRPGGGGAPALQALKGATPDGYTLGITYASALNLNPLINKDLGIDPLKDFIPVTNLMTLGVTIAVREDFPGKDIRDLVAMAKAKPGSVRIGVFGAGNKSWMAMLQERTGAKFLEVPFKGTTETMTAVYGGHIEAYYETPSALIGQKGKLKPLVNGGLAPSPLLPGVPTMRELYNFDQLSWYAVIAAAGTPQNVITWMSRELARAVKDPKVREIVEKGGFTVLGNTSEEFAKMLRADLEANAEIVKKYPDIR
jgi:tripartite-type tricarboxylate transporter receptor subunit TctC